MPPQTARIHMVCGRICAGKSTLCKTLAAAPNTILISEDTWLAALYGPEMNTLADYVKFSTRLKTALQPHLLDILRTGTSLVLDVPANTPQQRKWLKALSHKAATPHTLHFLDTPVETCKQRLIERTAQGSHPFSVSQQQFDEFNSHFRPPDASEGLSIKTYPRP